jgi:hypothetical protein
MPRSDCSLHTEPSECAHCCTMLSTRKIRHFSIVVPAPSSQLKRAVWLRKREAALAEYAPAFTLFPPECLNLPAAPPVIPSSPTAAGAVMAVDTPSSGGPSPSAGSPLSKVATPRGRKKGDHAGTPSSSNKDKKADADADDAMDEGKSTSRIFVVFWFECIVCIPVHVLLLLLLLLLLYM